MKIRPEDISGWRSVLADRPRYQSVAAGWQRFASARRRIERAGQGSPTFTIRETFATQSEAASAARAKLAELQRSSATMRVRVEPGNPALRAETPVELEGFRRGTPARWTVETATHELGRAGYGTRATLEQAADS